MKKLNEKEEQFLLNNYSLKGLTYCSQQLKISSSIITRTAKNLNLTLDKEEKVIIKALENADGTIFQSDLVEKTQFGKVKVSRILDRLEGRGLLERKRRGMTNVVVLK